MDLGPLLFCHKMEPVSPRLSQTTINGWIGLISILISINGFFVYKLVEKIDNTETQVYALREDVAILKTKLDGVLGRGVLPSSFPWKKASSFENTD